MRFGLEQHLCNEFLLDPLQGNRLPYEQLLCRVEFYHHHQLLQLLEQLISLLLLRHLLTIRFDALFKDLPECDLRLG